ncbi:MerR family transcriptional regulator [Nocardia zapadnayensis]|uniref:MerR family transcriptional regulator n=1 Tax=Nocardia rhamnosiphila TaxID=426716 RepID=UPI0022461616|nr:MerR family transcriptional regulator [Nocardia zapadnayensis]MCX0270548.1 MerR family transcriptional regulator [Nocardia zapadnayensis]
MAVEGSGIRIGELAQRTGSSTRALRYYERQGLVTAARGGNGYRGFDESAVGTVLRTRALLSAGLTTEVIRRVLPCTRDAIGRIEPCAEVVAVLQTEIDRMDALARSRDLLASILLDSGVPPTGRDAGAPACNATAEERVPGP